MRQAQGFSLFEVLVAVLIGSTLVLAMMTMYGTSIKRFAYIQSQTDLVDVVSDLPDLGENLRLTGLGLGNQGVLVHVDQLPDLTYQGNKIPPQWLSRSYVGTTTNLPSDQLTISYVAPMDMWDCEGNLVLGPRNVRLKNGKFHTVDGQVVIERYFVAKRSGDLALYCDAMHYVVDQIDKDSTRNKSSITNAHRNAIIDSESGTKNCSVNKGFTIKNRQQSGEMVMAGIDGFWVHLGIDQGLGIQFVSIKDYQESFMGRPILFLKVAVLHHGKPTQELKEPKSFSVFGQSITPTKDVLLPRRLDILDITLRNQGKDLGAGK